MALKVLLADDNLTAQKMGSKILADAGHTVIAVSNGAAAMKKFAAEKPELLILDVYMPGYSGLEVCEKVKGAPESAHVPVLLTVTNMEPYKAEDGNRVRADGVLIKPFEATDLLAVVQKLEEKLRPAAPAEPERVATQKMAAVQEFEDASYTEWKAEAAPEEPVRPPEMSAEVASGPALGLEDLAPAEPAPPPEPAPAFVEEAAPAAGAFDLSAPQPPAFDLAAPAPPADLAAPSYELQPQAEAAIAPPAELEFTSAPQAAQAEVAPAAELETTAQEAGEVAIVRDAALVTDAADMGQFATKFGVEHPEEIPVGIAMPEMSHDDILGIETPAAPPPVPATTEQPLPAAIFESGGAAAAAAPAREEEPVLEVGIDTQPLETPAIETQKLEAPEAARTQLISALPEPEERLAELVAPPAQAAPEPVAEEMEELPAPQPAADAGDITQKLVAQFAAELEAAQQEAPPEPEPEMEPPAEAATSVAAPDEQHVAEAVSRVLERYKGELIAAIVRELKG